MIYLLFETYKKNEIYKNLQIFMTAIADYLYFDFKIKFVSINKYALKEYLLTFIPFFHFLTFFFR